MILFRQIIFILWLATGFLSSASAQEPYCIHKTYAPEALKKDLDYLTRYLPHFHPDPYRYTSKDSLLTFIEQQKSRIDTAMNERQFRVLVKQIIARIGCGHTDINASRAYAKAVTDVVRPLLPLNIYADDSMRLYVLNNLSDNCDIFTGDEILKINGMAVQNVLSDIYSMYSSDGYVTTSKKQGVRYDWFKYYYGLYYGFANKHTLDIKHGDSTHTYEVKAIPSTHDILSISTKAAKDTIYKTKTCQFWIDPVNQDLAVIRISSFGGKHWRAFHRKTFRYIRQHHIKHLTIDLRDNGGGDIGKGIAFMSYLMPKPFCVSFDRKPNLIPLNRRLRMSFASRITPILFLMAPMEFPRHGRMRHYMPGIPKGRNRFRDTAFVMVNGKTFSMSVIAASYLKYRAGAKIVGEETGGGANGSNAIVSGKLYLPNTGVSISTPIYHIYHHVPVCAKGRGVMPDYPVSYNVEEIFQGRDKELEKIRTLIRKHTTETTRR